MKLPSASQPTHPTGPRSRSSQQAGFTYLGLLFLIALMGLMAAVAGSTWSFIAQRDRERDLLFAGREYRRAIEAYRQAHARLPQPYPTALAQLLGSRDEIVVRRYLRHLYFDPMTGSAEWGLVKTPQGGIVGVFSLSGREPLRRRSVYPDEPIDFLGAKSYRDWIFTPVRPSAPSAKDDRTSATDTVPAGGDQDDPGAPAPQWPGGRPPTPVD